MSAFTKEFKKSPVPNQTEKQIAQTVQFKDNRAKKSNHINVKESIDQSSHLVAQKAKIDSISNSPIQKKENKTGLPDNLKTGIENLSGYAMDDVKVAYNSDKPAQLNAHAYAQGTNIYMASGQEKHLPHEAWHVVQQKQGRVQPTMQMKGKVNINDDTGLEKEADVMGAKALNYTSANFSDTSVQQKAIGNPTEGVAQRTLAGRAFFMVVKNRIEKLLAKRLQQKYSSSLLEAICLKFYNDKEKEYQDSDVIREYMRIDQEAMRRAKAGKKQWKKLLPKRSTNPLDHIKRLESKISSNQMIIFRGMGAYQASNILKNRTGGGSQPYRGSTDRPKPTNQMAVIQTGYGEKDFGGGWKTEEWSVSTNTKGFSKGGAYIVATVDKKHVMTGFKTKDGEAGALLWADQPIGNVEVVQQGASMSTDSRYKQHLGGLIAGMSPNRKTPSQEWDKVQDDVQGLNQDMSNRIEQDKLYLELMNEKLGPPV